MVGKNSKIQFIIFFILALMNGAEIFAAQVVVFEKNNNTIVFENEMYQSAILDLDSFSKQNLPNINFEPSAIPSVNDQNKVVLSRFRIENRSDKKLFLEVAYPIIEDLKLYYLNKDGKYKEIDSSGFHSTFSKRAFESRHFIFSLDSLANEGVHEYILFAHSDSPVFLPLSIRTTKSVYDNISLSNLIYGCYIGVFIALLLYNLFILFATGDRSYIPYLSFLVFIALAQTAISGYGYQYLWPDTPSFNLYAIPLLSALAGISGLIFASMFLRVDHYFRTKFVKYLIAAMAVIYGIAPFFALFGAYNLSYDLLNFIGILVGIVLLTVAFKTAKMGYSPAIYYFVGWSVFFVSLILFALRNLSILPFDGFTNNVIFIGAGGEVILFSLALADKINVLRKEREESREEALRVSQENERIIRDQNIVLERRVSERTLELQEANEELSVTLNNLRETQTQLVDAEKMASLGQLTAGIAHEINNPINFVSSNITPLSRDLEDMYEIIDAYKAADGEAWEEKLRKAHQLREELDYDYVKREIRELVQGIHDGALRTSDIVKGLRNFSRLDEDTIKKADLKEGINSTLVLLKTKLRDFIEVKEEYDPEVGEIECYPGKLNQVFMNILNNAIYAVTHKDYKEGEKPTLTIKTRKNGDEVSIHLMDNGMGMDENTQKKIFDPFFTTKGVGEGTGLGMSIVYKIIDKHHGRLDVQSELGLGSEFIITLPMRQPKEFE